MASIAISQFVTCHGSVGDRARILLNFSSYTRQAYPPWRFDMSMMATMYVIKDGASSACACKYMLAYVPKRRSHSYIELGGLVRTGAKDMVGWPSFPITTDTAVSVGEDSAPSSTYPPSQILDFTFGSRVAPITKYLAREGCSPVVWPDDICCRMLLSRSCDGGYTDVACWGVNTTGVAGGNVGPLC